MRDEYVGRPKSSVPVSLTLDREAAVYVRELAGQRSLGRIISRLILEERARAEERQRLVRQLLAPRET